MCSIRDPGGFYGLYWYCKLFSKSSRSFFFSFFFVFYHECVNMIIACTIVFLMHVKGPWSLRDRGFF